MYVRQTSARCRFPWYLKVCCHVSLCNKIKCVCVCSWAVKLHPLIINTFLSSYTIDIMKNIGRFQYLMTHDIYIQHMYNIYIYILIWFGSGWCFPPSKLNNFWYGCNLVHWHTDVHWLMNWWLSLSRAAGGGGFIMDSQCWSVKLPMPYVSGNASISWGKDKKYFETCLGRGIYKFPGFMIWPWISGFFRFL